MTDADREWIHYILGAIWRIAGSGSGINPEILIQIPDHSFFGWGKQSSKSQVHLAFGGMRSQSAT